MPGISGIAIVDTSSLIKAFRTRRDRPVTTQDLAMSDFLAMLCVFAGAKISNHSAIVGSTFNVPPFSSHLFDATTDRSLATLGSKRQGVMLALHDQVTAQFDVLMGQAGTDLAGRGQRLCVASPVCLEQTN